MNDYRLWLKNFIDYGTVLEILKKRPGISEKWPKNREFQVEKGDKWENMGITIKIRGRKSYRKTAILQIAIRERRILPFKRRLCGSPCVTLEMLKPLRSQFKAF